MTAHTYASAHGSRFLEQLKDLIRIPSISTDPLRQGEIRRAAEWLADDLRRIGMTRVDILPTAGHPVIYAEWLGAGAGAPTVLIYGHYDVQPAVREDGWNSDPFEPVERDGKLFARGSSDDKGQVFAQIKAVESLLAEGRKPPANIKFLIEGEEEIGSPHLGAFVAEHRDLLRADVCVVSDTGMKHIDQPSICYATRGLMYLELEVVGPAQDLHSGGFGGIVHNPAQVIAEMIAALHSPDGRVAVPGFYDAVVDLSAAERETLRQSAPSEADWKAATGVRSFWGEAGYDLHERVGARPTLEVNGIVSGFYGAGSKTVLPARALAKLSCRIVPNQEPRTVFEQVKAFLLQIAPPTVRAEVRLIAEAFPAVMDLQSTAMTAASSAYERGWGRKPIFERGGGTLPILADFQRQLNDLPILLMGFGLQSDGAHGPDERFTIEMFHKGIATAICFYEELAKPS